MNIVQNWTPKQLFPSKLILHWTCIIPMLIKCIHSENFIHYKCQSNGDDWFPSIEDSFPYLSIEINLESASNFPFFLFIFIFIQFISKWLWWNFHSHTNFQPFLSITHIGTENEHPQWENDFFLQKSLYNKRTVEANESQKGNNIHKSFHSVLKEF